MTLSVEQQILRYLDDGFSDAAYLERAIAALPLSAIFDLICRLLRSLDPEVSLVTMLFVRDAINITGPDPRASAFRAAYPNSAIVKAVEESVFADNYFIRADAIYTLGKTCSYTSRSVLITAFERWHQVDPLLLVRLIGEMYWLQVERMERYVDRLLTSSHYLTRWAVIEIVNTLCNRPPTSKWLTVLCQDECELIWVEAEFEYRSFIASRHRSTEPKVPLVDSIEPILTFDRLSISFVRQLAQQGASQYTVAELARFVEQWQQERSSSSP